MCDAMIPQAREVADEKDAGAPAHGWIFYDGDCSSCRSMAKRFTRTFDARGFCFEPLQKSSVQARLRLTRTEALEEMRVLTVDGTIFHGADAVIYLAHQVWWAKPLAFLARLPWLHSLVHRTYRHVAAHRHCVIEDQSGHQP